MTTAIMLTEFLLARIAEDEATASEVHYWGCGTFFVDIADERGACTCSAAVRELAECGAKRRIVAEHQIPAVRFGSGQELWASCLLALAAVYADHPDYRDEWRI